MIGLAMIVDDQRVEQMQMTRTLTRSGLANTVLAFTYAEEALRHLDAPVSARPDLILLDVNLPRMNGFEFLEAAAGAHGPGFARSVVVMQTVELTPQDRVRMLRHPAVRWFLDKPLLDADVREIATSLNGSAAN